jgi:hypothetical protein
MPITSLTCPPPVSRSSRPTTPDYDLLDRALELYAEGKPKESAQKVFEHLFPGRSIPDLAKEAFTFPQGSSRVTVALDGDDLEVRVPLVRLTPSSNATAALRFVLTKMSGSGQLHQPRLRGEDIHLEFRDKVARLHPMKLMETLRRSPIEADQNDDWMVDQFGVAPLEREPIAALSPDEIDRAEQIWRAHWAEVEELTKESQRKRSMFFLNELTGFALHHVRWSLPLSGALLSRVLEAAGTFNDPDVEPTRREAALAKCTKEMKAVGRAELEKNLGHAEYSLSPRGEGTLEVLTNCLAGEYRDTLTKLRQSGKHVDAALGLFGTYCYLLGRFSWSEAVEAALVEGIVSQSGKPWREAAGALLVQAKVVLEIAEKVSLRQSAGDDPAAAEADSEADSEEQPS